MCFRSTQKPCRIHYSSLCRLHHNQHHRELERLRFLKDPALKVAENSRKLAIRKKSLLDPAVRAKEAEFKRIKRLHQRLSVWCTQAYLKAAAREDEIYAAALRKWIADHKRATQEPYLARVRRRVRRAYWADPEAARRKSQLFRHSNPEYRAKWNGKRGALEQELSDGTVTADALREMFASSYECPYCGDPYIKSKASPDHIVPLAQAGDRKLHSITNIVICCAACNMRKRDKDLRLFLAELIRDRIHCHA